MTRIVAFHDSHNASVCEIKNKEIIYVQEAERLDRSKRSTNIEVLVEKYKNQPETSDRERFRFGYNAAKGNYSKKKVLNEIKKCELVCANCHRARTFKRFNKASLT